MLSSVQMWGLLWLLARPDSPSQSSLTSDEFASLGAEINIPTSADSNALETANKMRINFLCGDNGDDAAKMTARYEAMAAVNKSMKSELGGVDSALDACAVIARKMAELLGAMSSRAKLALKDGATKDRLFISLLVMSDMRALGGETFNNSAWTKIVEGRCAPDFALTCSRLLGTGISLTSPLSENWKDTLKAIDFDHWLTARPGGVQGGAVMAPSAALINAVRAWSAFGGGDVDALFAAVRGDVPA
jgi:hypothetical protein